MTGEPLQPRHEEGDTVRITMREVYDLGLETSGKVDRVLDAFAAQARKVDDHEGRIVTLEIARAAEAPTIATLSAASAAHALQLGELRGRIDRTSWAPALIAGLVPTVLGAIIVATVLPK